MARNSFQLCPLHFRDCIRMLAFSSSLLLWNESLPFICLEVSLMPCPHVLHEKPKDKALIIICSWDSNPGGNPLSLSFSEKSRPPSEDTLSPFLLQFDSIRSFLCLFSQFNVTSGHTHLSLIFFQKSCCRLFLFDIWLCHFFHPLVLLNRLMGLIVT